MQQYNCSNNELRHYGVLGMKWGIRKNPTRAYTRAMHKKNKLSDKSDKLDLKANRKMKKGTKLLARASSSVKIQKGYNLVQQASSMSLKAAKIKKKGKQWTRHMNKAFSSYSVEKIPNGNIESGKNFVYRMLYGDDSYKLTKCDASK